MSEVFAASKGISSIRSSSPLHRVTTTTRPAGSLHFQLIFSLSFPSQSLINVLARENPSPSTLLLFTFIFNFVLERDPHTTSRPSRPPTPPLQSSPRSQPRERTRISTCGTLLCVSLSSASRARPSCARSFLPSIHFLPFSLSYSSPGSFLEWFLLLPPSILVPVSPPSPLGGVWQLFPLASPPSVSPYM